MPNRRPARPRVFRVAVLFAMATAAPFLAAQDTATPIKVGDYTLSGMGSFGYRFVDLNGNQGSYNELLNLQQGLRLFDFELDAQPTEPNHGWFDYFSLNTLGLGGDPFPVVNLSIRKNGLYELRVNYRAMQYVYELPQTAYTPNRGWNDRRRFADVDFGYTPTRKLRFHFFYNRTVRVGTDLATSPFFYLPLAPDVWEAFGRATPVTWVVPLQEKANLFGAGIDYRLGKTDFHVEQSYRTYNNPANLQGFANQPVTLLGPSSPTQNVVVQNWNAFSSFNIPVTSLRLDNKVNERLQLRAGYVYTHASGPTSLDGSVLVPGISPGLPGVVNPSATLNYVGTGTTLLATQTADAGFTLKLFDPLDLVSDYSYRRYAEGDIEALQATSSNLSTPVSLSQDNTRWDFGIHTVDTLLVFTPVGGLSIRAGVQFLKEDIVATTNGETDIGTQRTKSYSPIANVAWIPSKKFSVRGGFQSRVVVDPYVRISPEQTVGSTIRTRFSPSDKWGIDNTWSFYNMKTEDIGFLAHSRTNSTSLWYQPLDRLGFQGGFTYGNMSSQNTIAFLQGVPPLTGLLSTDQTIDRVYSWGFKTNPVGSLTLSFTGQFLRSTGLGTLTGENSTYGPLTWPAWTAEIGYTTKHVGRTVLAWQRSYYYEDLFRATDFSVNMFTLRFERPLWGK
jgi:hypothetical protein